MLLNKDYDPQFQAGLYPDFKNDTAPLFIDGLNVQFSAGKVRPVPSLLQYAKVSDQPVKQIWSQLVFSLPSVFYQIGADVFELRENVVTKRFVGLTPKIQFATFGNFTLLADGGVLAAKRTEFGDFVRIPGAPVADFVVVFSPFVLVFHDRQVSWCSIDNIDEWDPLAEGSTAGSLPIRDMDSEIVSVLAAFGGVMVGSEKKQWIVNFLGFPNWFGVKRMDALDIGAFNREALCIVKSRVVGMGPRGVWDTDGFTYRFLDFPAFKAEIFDNLQSPENVLLANDYANERVLIVYDTKKVNRLTSILDYRNTNYSKATYNFVSVDRGGVYPFTLFGTPEGWLFTSSTKQLPQLRNSTIGLQFKTKMIVRYGYGGYGYGSSGYGQQVYEFVPPTIGGGASVIIKVNRGGDEEQVPGLGGTSDTDLFLETRDMDFGRPDQEKYLDMIIFQVSDREQAGDFEYAYAIKDEIQETLRWSAWGPFLPGLPVFPRLTFRHIKIRMRNNNARVQWQLTGIEYHGEFVEGRYGG